MARGCPDLCCRFTVGNSGVIIEQTMLYPLAMFRPLHYEKP